MYRHLALTQARLFLDDTWIEETTFVTRQWHQPRKYPEPVLAPEHPWERWCPSAYGTVLHWRGTFRMWYIPWNRLPRRGVCYAESEDGVAWEKPKLGVCEFNGSKDNNIVLQATTPQRYIDDLPVIDDPADVTKPVTLTIRGVEGVSKITSANRGELRLQREKHDVVRVTYETSFGDILRIETKP
jgi:hypothetical protein